MQQLVRTAVLIQQGIDEGLHTGAQIYVSRHGKPIAELAIGQSRNGVPMTHNTLVPWFSSTKPVAAVAILQLVESGKLRLDDLVARHIPEFAPQGKADITLRHLLTHTAGLRWVELGWPETTWPQIVNRLCHATPERDWPPGKRAGYHPTTTWFVLGEVIRRVSGLSFEDYVRQQIFEPLGMRDSWVGMSDQQYDAYGQRMGTIVDMTKPERPEIRYASRAGATHCAPGSSGFGPIRELGMFYEMLLAGGERGDERILSADSVAEMTRRQREGMFDEPVRETIDWGLGLILNSSRYGSPSVPYGYGRHASDATFGHSGSQSSVAFADPANKLVVAALANGAPGEPAHQARIKAWCEAIYEDVGAA
jgi:CubicO group peptidase (beta-lactamase class C family)